MKLLNCTKCHDIRAIGTTTVVCLCGHSRAHYLSDQNTVEFSGASARVLGMRNPDYRDCQSGRDYPWFVIREGSPSIRRVDCSEECDQSALLRATRARLAELERSCTHSFNKGADAARCTICGADFGWQCADSPDGVCHYDTDQGKVRLIDGTVVDMPANHDPEFETEDSCIFCGDPSERL